MKLLDTAHGRYVTGSDIADAVVHRHQERVAAFQIDTLVVPFVDAAGERATVRIMVGGPYIIASATVASSLPELSDPGALHRIRHGEPDEAPGGLDDVSVELERLELPPDSPLG